MQAPSGLADQRAVSPLGAYAPQRMPIAVRRVPPIHALAGHGATRRNIRREIPQSFQPALRVQVPAFAFVNDSANVLRASRSPPNSWDKFGDTRLQEYPVIHNHPRQKLPLVTACHTNEVALSSVGESWLEPDYESAALPTELRQPVDDTAWVHSERWRINPESSGAAADRRRVTPRSPGGVEVSCRWHRAPQPTPLTLLAQTSHVPRGCRR